MTNADDRNRVATALDYLRRNNQFFEFDDQERVVRVGVSGAVDVDKVAEHVGHLRDLEKLTFYTPGLTDKGLWHLNALVRLKDLSIDGSRFTSAGLAHLGAMSQLEELYIGDARWLDRAGSACIARLSSLRRLSLRGGSFFDADLEPLAALANLEELSFSENDDLEGTFCRYLTNSQRLNHLNAGEHVTDQGLENIAKLASLKELYIAGPFTNAGLEHLIALKNLSTLAIESEHVSAGGVAVAAQLPELNDLHFDTPQVADDAVATLLRCSALEELSFRRSALSDAGLQLLRDGLPKCGVSDYERDQRPAEPENASNADRYKLDSSTPFGTLLTEASDFDLVDGTFDKIFARYKYWVASFEYSPIERVIMLVWQSARMIDAGGFEYFFSDEFEGDPDFHITAEAYRIAGIERSHEAFRTALSLFPDEVLPQDLQKRRHLYEAANRSAREGLNRKFRHDDRVRAKKLAEFIRAHVAHLGDLDAAP